MTTLPSRDEIIALEKSYWDAMKSKDGTRTAQLSGKTALVTGARGGDPASRRTRWAR